MMWFGFNKEEKDVTEKEGKGCLGPNFHENVRP